MAFCDFWKYIQVFAYFKLIYFWISARNSSMEEDGGIFSKALDWKPLFLLKVKIEQKLRCLNKEYNASFKHNGHPGGKFWSLGDVPIWWPGVIPIWCSIFTSQWRSEPTSHGRPSRTFRGRLKDVAEYLRWSIFAK